MASIEKAVSWMEKIAKDNSHGYDQAHRNGPNYDCSSLIGTALNQAGFNVSKSSTTRNLENQLLKAGFEKIPVSSSRKRGDIFLAVGEHVVMCTDANNIVHASINEKGTVSGGKSGDQTGKEICVRSYYNGGWDYHFRLKGQATSNKTVHAIYRVKTKKHGWLPGVTDWNDYAGWENSDITDFALKVSAGSVKYRVHVKGGGWLPYVTGYNINDHNNGYAGNGKTIDAIEIYYNTPDSIRPYKRACYKVNNYSAQYDNEKGNGQDGYAGAFGVPIKKVWVKIV